MQHGLTAARCSSSVPVMREGTRGRTCEGSSDGVDSVVRALLSTMERAMANERRSAIAVRRGGGEW